MIDAVKSENGIYGRRAVATGAWSSRLTSYVLDNGIIKLELNSAKGWESGDVSFLIDLPQLVVFEIYDLARVLPIDSIHHLPKLRSLTAITYCKTAILFSAFPELERCAVQWRRRSTSLFDCIGLKKLFIDHYDGKDLTDFERLSNLESLTLLGAPIKSLKGIGALKNLRHLRLGNLRQLSSLAGIEQLVKLQELDVSTCRAIESIKEVGCLSDLQRLFINNLGDIASLKPLDKLTNLTSVLFWESTKILDGDLSPLTRQRNLSAVSFQNRRHYSHRREELQTHGEGDYGK